MQHVNKDRPTIQIISQSKNIVMLRFSHHNEYHIDKIMPKHLSLRDLITKYTSCTSDEPNADLITDYIIEQISKCTLEERKQILLHFND